MVGLEVEAGAEEVEEEGGGGGEEEEGGEGALGEVVGDYGEALAVDKVDVEGDCAEEGGKGQGPFDVESQQDAGGDGYCGVVDDGVDSGLAFEVQNQANDDCPQDEYGEVWQEV